MIAVVGCELGLLYGRAQALLDAADPRNNLLLGVLKNSAAIPPASAFGWEVRDAQQLLGVCVYTAPFPMLLSDMPTMALDAVADALWSRDLLPLDINGLQRNTQYVSERLARMHGARVAVSETLRLFELRSVLPVTGVRGRMRLATPDDDRVVEEFIGQFEMEAQLPERRLHDRPAFVARLLAMQSAFLWDVAGHPVALAVKGRDLGVGASIGPVFTPSEQRGHGYATALVAALSQRLLDEGKVYTCLFTDLANPVSNRIYPKVGYCVVEDFQDWHLTISGAG